MQDLTETLAGMTWNEAHNHLMTLDLPLKLRTELAEKANELRQLNGIASKRVKLIEYQHGEMWHSLIAPLKYELSNARVGLALKDFSSAPERHTAFSEYILVMEKLLAGLVRMQLAEQLKLATLPKLGPGEKLPPEAKPRTPAEIANEQGRPHSGAHWTHWISDKTKHRIETLFDAIPTKAKRPRPFPYRIPPDLFKEQQAALQRRTLNELDLVRQEIQLLRDLAEPSGEQTLQLRDLEDEENLMKRAMWHMTFGLGNEPVPSTWQGLKLAPDAELKIKQFPDFAVAWDKDEPHMWTDAIEKSLRLVLGIDDKRRKPPRTRPRRYKKNVDMAVVEEIQRLRKRQPMSEIIKNMANGTAGKK